MAYPIYWLVACVLWTLLGCLPFRSRLSSGWRMYLALYLLVTTILVIKVVESGKPPGQFTLLVSPGASIAIVRLGMHWLRPH